MLFDATVAALATRLTSPVWTYNHRFDLMRVAVWRQSGHDWFRPNPLNF